MKYDNFGSFGAYLPNKEREGKIGAVLAVTTPLTSLASALLTFRESYLLVGAVQLGTAALLIYHSSKK